MMNAASTSNPSFIWNVGEAYPYPSHVIAPNFVTVKLSGRNKYNMWKTQMICLLESHHMFGFIEGQFPCPAGNGKGKVGDMEAWVASDSLVKGWILGSLSEDAVNKAVNHLTHKQKKTVFTAKDLWDELKRSYGPSVREQAETKLTTRQAESVIEMSSIYENEKSKDEPKEGKTKDEIHDIRGDDFDKRYLYKTVLEGSTYAIDLLNREGNKPWDKLTNNGNTVLHVAVGSSTKNHELFKKLLERTPTENTLLDVVNSDGSTLLHVAAIGGNIEVVNMLVKRNPELLLATDKEGHIPLAISVSNMHFNTSRCLFEHMKEKGYFAYVSAKSGEELVVLAISCQDFSLAEMIILKYQHALVFVFDSDAVLTTLAQNFPRELNFWERRGGFYCIVTAFNLFLKAIVHPFIKDTSQVYEEAETLLRVACYNISDRYNSSTYHRYYTNSIFEATRQNSSTFIRYIMRQFPDAIWSANEDDHNFIQYSVINRSEKIYNLLYEMSEHNNIYKTIKDSSGNNLLHLAARLAPTTKLNLISGAALQIQRELQWFKEVERFVCPLNRIQKNSDDETPAMVFTREHKDLVIEGENWIKKTTGPEFPPHNTITALAPNQHPFLFGTVHDNGEWETAMIIAFGATLFLVFGEANLLMLIPIGALTCLPITSFVTLQFPLIVELISATYGGGIFVREETEGSSPFRGSQQSLSDRFNPDSHIRGTAPKTPGGRSWKSREKRLESALSA
ncbi:ankyrin repeat-containing domain, PGG domain protein [Tanacetum coccineum]